MDEPKDGAPEAMQEEPDTGAQSGPEELPAGAERQPQQVGAEAGTQADTDQADREAALLQRERAIEVKERHFKALEMLEKRNLPQNLIDYIDLETEQSMRKSIELAARARTAPNVPEAPEGAGRPPKSGTYEEYRRYYTQ